MSSIAIKYLKQWEGRKQVEGDLISPWALRAKAAVLGWQATPDIGAVLPPL